NKHAAIKLYSPAQLRFKWIGLLIEFVPIQAIASLQAERIACSQTSWQQSPRFTCCQYISPELHNVGRSAVNLEAILTSITSTRNDTVYTINYTRHTMIVTNALEINLCQRL